MTYTYVICDISHAAFNEIAAKLKQAGYDHAFMVGGEIDMHGIARACTTRLRRHVDLRASRRSVPG
jgi:Trm5-related predicted tRNA methylase